MWVRLDFRGLSRIALCVSVAILGPSLFKSGACSNGRFGRLWLPQCIGPISTLRLPAGGENTLIKTNGAAIPAKLAVYLDLRSYHFTPRDPAAAGKSLDQWTLQGL